MHNLYSLVKLISFYIISLFFSGCIGTEVTSTFKESTMLLIRWRSGLARLQQWSYYLQGPGFESNLGHAEFFSCKKGFSTPPKQTLTSTSVLWYNIKKHAFCHDVELPQ